MYLDLFPKFKIVEVNRSYANTAGHVLAIFPAKSTGIAKKTVSLVNGGSVDVLENGVIAGLNKDGEVISYAAASCAQPCLVMNDELPTSPIEGLDQYCEVFESGVTYPRLLPLYLGDVFTTNNFVAGSATSPKYAKVASGILTLQDAADTDTLFVVKSSKLPAGQAAYEFTYVGKVVASAE